MIQYLNPLQWMKWCGQFLFEWCTSIPWRQVSAGLLAICLVGALSVLGFLAYSDGGSWRRNLVAGQVEQAFEKEDFATAELLTRRQINSGDDSTDNLYRLALTQYQLEKKDEAISVMRQLVATRRSDEAALWLASTTLDKMKKLHSEEPANPELAIAVVRNQIFLDRHADAVQTLADSIARMKTPEEQQALRPAMGDTIAAWVSEIKRQPSNTPAERLRVLKLLQVAL